MKTAVVLFNLGGPDSLDAVEPFLRNLFSDPAIIRLPNPFRALLARFIARRRAPVSQAMYRAIGGRSPILGETEAQARALEQTLGGEAKVFIAMRYWAPRARDTAAAVRQYAPERIVALPLYPQFSTTTTASSLQEWRAEAARVGLVAPTVAVCCYPTLDGWAAAQASAIGAALDALPPQARPPRVLLSAHGLPQRVVDAGDPYQWQVEQGAKALVARLAGRSFEPVVCYQSRVGRLKWIGPETVEEIRRCGRDGTAAVVVPVAFVSEHSETLVELDRDYRAVAAAAGVPTYVRVPALGTAPGFMAGLNDLVGRALAAGQPLVCGSGERVCPGGFAGCPLG